MRALVGGLKMAGALAFGFITSVVTAYNHQFFREQYFKYAEMGLSTLSANAERALQPKDEFKECTNGCPEMVVIPAGQFVMGSPDGKTSIVGLDGKPRGA
jgi:formylglycine-generating enzyme required for sulfatase activity